MESTDSTSNAKSSESLGPSDVFIVDGARLRPGDIVLSTNRVSATSGLIRHVTKSDFSHAAIVMYDAVCVEAVSIGVRVINIGRAHVSDLGNIRVLRVKVPGASDVAAKAARKAKSYLYRPYWVEGAFLSRFNRSGIAGETERFFCSHLVTHCFQSAGLTLLPGRSPESTAPGDFIFSECLEDVTADVYFSEDRRYAPEQALDFDGYPEGVEKVFSELNQNIARGMRDRLSVDPVLSELSKHIHSFTDCLGMYMGAMRFSGKFSGEQLCFFDETVVKTLRECRLAEFFSIDVPAIIPLAYISIEEWVQIFDFSILSGDELNKMKLILERDLRGLEESLVIFDGELDQAEKFFAGSDFIGRFEGLEMLVGFYRERVASVKNQVSIVGGKIRFLDHCLMERDNQGGGGFA